MINVQQIISDEEQCLGHTGLKPEGFAYLLEIFKSEYDLYEKQRHKERF